MDRHKIAAEIYSNSVDQLEEAYTLIYSQAYRNDHADGDYSFFDSLSEEQKIKFKEVSNRIMVDAISGFLAAIDEGSIVDKTTGKELRLTLGDDDLEDVLDYFIEYEQSKGSPNNKRRPIF